MFMEVWLEKSFKTIEEQIDILISRNMKINYKSAYNILVKNNYYYLINGYKDIFIDKKCVDEKYKRDSEFDEIYAIFNFDKNIKVIFLKYLLLIENELDSYIAYEFSKNYGHKNYLISQNFDNLNLKKIPIQKFINEINLEIRYQYKNSNKMIVHYLDKYNYIPLWVLVRILSFGKISKFYSLMKQGDQNSISKKYNLKPKEFETILHNLTLIRNICAHDEKLYDIVLKNRIMSTKYHKLLKIESINGNYKIGTRDLFSIVIIMKLLLDKNNFVEFYEKIISEINILNKKLISVEIECVLNKMGFSKTYKRLLYMK